MRDLSSTQFFQVESGPQIQAKDILEIVLRAACAHDPGLFPAGAQ